MGERSRGGSRGVSEAPLQRPRGENLSGCFRAVLPVWLSFQGLQRDWETGTPTGVVERPPHPQPSLWSPRPTRVPPRDPNQHIPGGDPVPVPAATLQGDLSEGDLPAVGAGGMLAPGSGAECAQGLGTLRDTQDTRGAHLALAGQQGWLCPHRGSPSLLSVPAPPSGAGENLGFHG